MAVDPASPTIGVVIVTYRSSDVIVPCLESVLNSYHRRLKIAVCDNASPDDTVKKIRDWADGQSQAPHEDNVSTSGSPIDNRHFSFREHAPRDGELDTSGELPLVTLVHTGLNRGYAGGINVGLEILRRDPEIAMFWILNPDCVVPPATATCLLEAARKHPDFGLMGGRIKYVGPEEEIQSDGGRVHPWTGMCGNIGLGQPAGKTPFPDPAKIDFVNGACLVASRKFLEHAGPMVEDYFLYYEEVDWAFRRDNLPIVYADGAEVYHHVGTSIGSATLKRKPSAFANYFNYRNRIRFMRRFYPARLPVAYGYAFLKVAALIGQGAYEEAHAAFRGLVGLPPPAAVRNRLTPEACLVAFPASGSMGSATSGSI